MQSVFEYRNQIVTSRLTAFAEKREERRVVARLCVALKYVAGDITF